MLPLFELNSNILEKATACSSFLVFHSQFRLRYQVFEWFTTHFFAEFGTEKFGYVLLNVLSCPNKAIFLIFQVLENSFRVVPTKKYFFVGSE